MNWDGMNRRKFPRVNYPCLIKIKQNDSSEETLLTHTDNIGIGGVCVTLKNSIKMFTPVVIELDLMDMKEHIKCDARIVWSVRRKSTEEEKPMFYDVGIEFGELSEDAADRLQQIIKRLASKR